MTERKVLHPSDITEERWAREMGPRLVTERELFRVLWPYIAEYPWARDALRDLWRMGAPVPNPAPDGSEQRVLLPRQFAKWWRDVAERMGVDLSPAEVLRATGKR